MIANQVNVTSKTEIANSNKIVKGEDDMIYDFSGWTFVYSGNTQQSLVTLPDTANAKLLAIMVTNSSNSMANFNMGNVITNTSLTFFLSPISKDVFIIGKNTNQGATLISNFSMPYILFMKE